MNSTYVPAVAGSERESLLPRLDGPLLEANLFFLDRRDDTLREFPSSLSGACCSRSPGDAALSEPRLVLTVGDISLPSLMLERPASGDPSNMTEAVLGTDFVLRIGRCIFWPIPSLRVRLDSGVLGLSDRKPPWRGLRALVIIKLPEPVSDEVSAER